MKITRDMLMDVFQVLDHLARDDVQLLFGASASAAQEHIQLMRKEKLLYIKSWRKPERRGGWTPLYALRRGDEKDCPPPGAKVAPVKPPSREGLPVVVRSRGLDPRHIERAAERTSSFGLWGGLVSC